ncbi:MAG: CAP domain-containing protein [Burkholderiaceae bacterium]|nr:CAP domain-containing protein [Burkholderiaceae bacterium]
MVAAALAACGGGSDDSDTGGAQGSGAGPTCGLAGFQSEVLQRVNAVRAAGAQCGTRGGFSATGALQWHGALVDAATRHSQDMAERNFFSHTGSDNSTPGQRITEAGYDWSLAGENIAAGYRSVQEVMDGWMSSDSHCANIMNPTLRDIGVACVPGTASNTYGTYWTMDLAAP